MTTVMTIVLTVEDEALIGEYLRHVLYEGGYDVVASSSADEALTILESRGDICLMITDIAMPGTMDGLMLAATVHSKWPAIKIIIASGNGRPDADLMPAHSQFLPKPYWPKRVIDMVQLALEA